MTMTTRHHRQQLCAPSRACDSSRSTLESSSYSSYGFRSTDPSSFRSGGSLRRMANHADEDDMSPPHNYRHSGEYPSASAETYDSVLSESEHLDVADETHDECDLPVPTEDAIPPALPQYRASVVDPLVRPSTPDAFGRLFPSLDRLSIRHDDLTPDGNMNLRVDTAVPCSDRGPVTVQLFHLRMHDLARREFSLRRYCRGSGREVCNSKRAYGQPPPVSRPGIQRSVSTAIRSIKTPFRRRPSINSSPSQHKRLSSGASAASFSWDTASIRSMRMRRDSLSSDKPPPPASALVPTKAIKLEFSNYARVDVTRTKKRTSIYYDFEWWGHNYTWRCVHDNNLDVVCFHLIRDGRGSPVAHITPEMRSPNQIEADEWAGGWVPPCHMWISDQSVVDAVTDVADVIVAAGLIALVDNCIKDRWHVKKKPNRTRRAFSVDLHGASSLPLMQGIFHRRYSEQKQDSPLRASPAITAC